MRQKKINCKHEPSRQVIEIDTKEESYLIEDIKLLKQMITYKDTIISDKCQVILLLNEKIMLLENKVLSIGKSLPTPTPYYYQVLGLPLFTKHRNALKLQI